MTAMSALYGPLLVITKSLCCLNKIKNQNNKSYMIQHCTKLVYESCCLESEINSKSWEKI